jgi:hypothetical protein
MALHCSICNSTDVIAGFDKMQCLTCGAILDPLGQPAEVAEYIGSEATLTAVEPIDVVPLPSGVDGYIEGGTPVEYPSAGPETTVAGEDTGGAEPEAPEEDLSSMTKAELADVAAERGVDIPSSATKAEMLEALA